MLNAYDVKFSAHIPKKGNPMLYIDGLICKDNKSTKKRIKVATFYGEDRFSFVLLVESLLNTHLLKTILGTKKDISAFADLLQINEPFVLHPSSQYVSTNNRNIHRVSFVGGGTKISEFPTTLFKEERFSRYGTKSASKKTAQFDGPYAAELCQLAADLLNKDMYYPNVKTGGVA